MNGIILIVCGIILLWNVLLAFKRGVRRSLLRLATAAAAAVGAYFLTKPISAAIVGVVLPMVEGWLAAMPELAGALAGNPEAALAIAALVQMLTAPILFLTLYGVAKLVLLVPYYLLAFITTPHKTDDEGRRVICGVGIVSRLVALPVGIVIALVGIGVISVPMFGYVGIMQDMMSIMHLQSAPAFGAETTEQVSVVAHLSDGTGEAPTPEAPPVAEAPAPEAQPAPTAAQRLTDFYNTNLATLSETSPIAGVYRLVGQRMFDSLTATEWNGTALQLQNEMMVLADVIENVQKLSATPVAEYGAAECDAADALARDIGDSKMLATLCSGVLSTAANSWLDGGTFFGFALPDLGENGNLLVESLLKVFATSAPDNIASDLSFFTGIFRIAVNYDLLEMLQGGMDDDALATFMTGTGFLTDTKVLLATHTRMQPVGDALVDVGMRTVIKELGLPEDYKESCGEMLNDMTTALQAVPVKEDGKIDEVALADSLTTVFEQHELNVSASAVKLVADGVSEHFTAEEVQTMTTEEIIDKLVERFDEVDVESLKQNGTLPDGIEGIEGIGGIEGIEGIEGILGGGAGAELPPAA